MALESVMKGTGRHRTFTVKVSIDDETFFQQCAKNKILF